ncbi:MAG: hypothetical protein WCF90_04715 [Methanomicrobiales archaeon]
MGVNPPVWQAFDATVINASAGLNLSRISLTIISDNLEIYADHLLEKVFYNMMKNTLLRRGTVLEISVSF